MSAITNTYISTLSVVKTFGSTYNIVTYSLTYIPKDKVDHRNSLDYIKQRFTHGSAIRWLNQNPFLDVIDR